MFVELHMIQNFAPSNLNRDDTGAPKDCEFGGVRRARISSQAFKRAMRTEFRKQRLLPQDQLAVRTKRVAATLAERLVARGRDAAVAGDVAHRLIESMGLGFDKKNEEKTEYLLFLGEAEIEALAALANDAWDTLMAASAASNGKKGGSDDATRKIGAQAKALLDGGRAADLALFGRMLADLPDRNVDAACQVAHAISTNRVSMEFDFYTAVDDLLPEDTAGADMLGTVEFNSACFYRYCNVDLDQLLENLGGDEGLARGTLEAFLRSSIAAIPTGKQNSMAAQNPPSLVMAVARDRGLWSLANAFVKPVRPSDGAGLIERSIQALDDYWGRLTAMYGTAGIAGTWVTTLDGDSLSALADHRVATVDDLVAGVLDAARFTGKAATA